jgi:hypothetical protein
MNISRNLIKWIGQPEVMYWINIWATLQLQLLVTAEYFTDLWPEFVSSDSSSGIQWISVKARFTLRKITQVRCKLTLTIVRFLKCEKSLSRVSAEFVWTIFQRLVQTNLSPVYVKFRRVNRPEINLNVYKSVLCGEIYEEVKALRISRILNCRILEFLSG